MAGRKAGERAIRRSMDGAKEDKYKTSQVERVVMMVTTGCHHLRKLLSKGEEEISLENEQKVSFSLRSQKQVRLA